MILGRLPPQDLQAARVDSFMNKQVIVKVQRDEGDAILRLQKFTKFLCKRLPELRDRLTPAQAVLNTLTTTGHPDVFLKVLYNERGRFIDILKTQQPSKLDELEQKFKKSGLAWPPKFENIFRIANILQDKEEDLEVSDEEESRMRELIDLREWYEVVRNFEKEYTENREAQSHISDFLKEATRELDHTSALAEIDKVSYAFLEQVVGRVSSTSKKNRDLFAIHTHAAMSQIVQGDFDSAIQALSKLSPLLQKAKKPYHRYAKALQALAALLISSRVDANAAEKIFTLFVSISKTVTDEDKRTKLLYRISAMKITLFAAKAFESQSQDAVVQLLKTINTVADADTKLEHFSSQVCKVFGKLFESMDNSPKRLFSILTGIYNATSAAPDSDAKYLMLIAIYSFIDCGCDDNLDNLDPAFSWIQGDMDTNIDSTIEKIADPELKKLMLESHWLGWGP